MDAVQLETMMIIQMMPYCVSGSRGHILATYLLKQHNFMKPLHALFIIAVLCMLIANSSLPEVLDQSISC